MADEKRTYVEMAHGEKAHVLDSAMAHHGKPHTLCGLEVSTLDKTTGISERRLCGTCSIVMRKRAFRDKQELEERTAENKRRAAEQRKKAQKAAAKKPTPKPVVPKKKAPVRPAPVRPPVDWPTTEHESRWEVYRGELYGLLRTGGVTAQLHVKLDSILANAERLLADALQTAGQKARENMPVPKLPERGELLSRFRETKRYEIRSGQLGFMASVDMERREAIVPLDTLHRIIELLNQTHAPRPSEERQSALKGDGFEALVTVTGMRAMMPAVTYESLQGYWRRTHGELYRLRGMVDKLLGR